jgi:ferredoxin
MKISVDMDRCCGSAMCTSIAARYFEMDSGGRLLVRRDTVDDEDLDTIEEAVTCCPTEAILLGDASASTSTRRLK